MENTENISDIWPDEQDYGASMDAERWKRGRKWKAAALAFWRSEAVRVGMTGEGHAKLKRLRLDVEKVQTNLTERIAAQTRGRGQWKNEFVEDGMKEVHEWLAENEIGAEAPSWIAYDRAAAKTLQRLKYAHTHRRTAEPLRVTTLRIRAGTHYRKKLEPFEEGGVTWLELPICGRVGLSLPVDGLENVSYCEMAMIRQSWWIRFAFAEERKDKAGVKFSGAAK